MASSVVLIAVGLTMSCTKRVTFRPGFGLVPHIGMMPQGVTTRTAADLAHLQMRVPAPLDEDIPEFGKHGATTGGTQLSYQDLPPPVINAVNTRRLLHNWANSFIDPSKEGLQALLSPQFPSPQSNVGLPLSLLLPSRSWPDNNALVIDIMREVIDRCESIAEATVMFPQLHTASLDNKREERVSIGSDDGLAQATMLFPQLETASFGWKSPSPDHLHAADPFPAYQPFEMVGLIPKGFEISFVESGSSAVDASVLALAVFSRHQQLKDDNRGSLYSKLVEQYGEEVTEMTGISSGKQFDVFEVQGIADAPGLPERSARVLLSKIAKYARKERRIVVVSSRRACSSKYGTDLTEYYVRLGFEKVEMQDGKHKLVYTGTSTSAEDQWVENQQIMVGMNL